MADLIKNFAAIIRVKTIIALIVVIVFAILALQQVISSDTVMTVVSMVIAFYFRSDEEK